MNSAAKADPVFLTLDEVLALHQDQVRRYGGLPGIREQGLLSSALGAVSATFDGQFLHQSLYEMAAAYLFHLAQNHPFIDGNKRIALAAALIFLWMNDVEIEVEDDQLTDLVFGVARGEVTKSQVAVFLQSHARPAS
ncbi:MAG: type II toxin-antitoxin system death-on-curing family toxin [Acidobacteriota bacterium]|nr:type II toxin-antitoxin system death-on-curing family toxin [Acidobacteriota bacterium]